MADQWEHASMSVVANTIEVVSAEGVRTMDPDGGNLRRAMIALDTLSAEGWEVVSDTMNRHTDGALFSTFLLRRPKTAGSPQIH